jgi:hypothetical protein
MKLSSFLLLAACGLCAPAASAQQVIFSDDFEAGLGNWTATGQWHLETSSDPCGSTFGPFPSGSNMAWFGSAPACTFDTLPLGGSLTLNDWIQLPNAESISLRYWANSESEYCWFDWDIHEVIIIRDGLPNVVASYCPQGSGGSPADLDLPWHERRVDLSAYRGTQIRLAFHFDARDDLSNSFRGWLIDHVRILGEPGVRYCPPEGFHSTCPCHWIWTPAAGGCRNSFDKQSTLHSEGSPTLSADTLRMNAVQLPPATTALLSQGTASTQVLFGDGLRCVGGTRIRMGAQQAVNGAASWPAPGDVPLSVRGEIPAAGATRYYYVFYRDLGNYCSSGFFNLSDAQQITWTP